MTQRNLDIRKKAKEAGIPLWRIAEALQIHENSFYRMMRYEMSASRKHEIFAVIKGLKCELKAVN